LTVRRDLGNQLEVYYRLLAAWNQKINLSGLELGDAGPDAIDRLLIEPLVASRHIVGGTKRAIDIGSGGGSPAIPISLSRPDIDLLMVEAKTRKSVFLREAIRALGLARCDVVTARFEELLANPALHETHELLTIRAVRLEARVLMGLQAFIRPGGQVFLFRSGAGNDGLASLTPPLIWRASHPLLEARGSRLVVLEKQHVGSRQGERFT
jgi:16S rRNA (guanine527-N7)-methyltransferase